jgi:hypothetical protein
MINRHSSVIKENSVVISILIKMMISLTAVTTITITTTLTEGKKFTTWTI